MALYSEKNRQPPCETCKPKIHVRSINILRLWELVRNQWIYSFNGIEAINVLAIDSALNDYQVPKEYRVEYKKKLMLYGDAFVSALKEYQQKNQKEE